MRTINDLVFGGVSEESPIGAAPSDVVAKASQLYGEHGIGAYGAPVQVPKTWFTDPFALLDNLGLGYKSAPSSVSYETLRQMSEKNVIIAAIIQTRSQQVSSFVTPQPNRYSIGFKIQRKVDPLGKLSHSELGDIKRIEAFLAQTGEAYDDDRDDLKSYVKKLVRDRLVYDQIATEIVAKYSGKPHSFFAVPASTIRLASQKKRRGGGYTREENEPKYVQVVDGVLVNEYLPRELGFDISNPRTDLRAHGYGYSELEMLITTITAHLWAEEWNRKMFSQGATTKGILNIKGNINPQQLDAFKRQWLAQISGVSNAWRTPVVNSNDDIQWINLQPTNNEMGFQGWMEYLIKVACACYLIDPSEINFDLRAGVANAPMFMTTNEAQQKLSKDRGLRPLVEHVQAHINRHIIRRIDPKYEMVFLGLDAKTEEQAIELRLKELGSYKTLNEIREMEQLSPVEHGDIVPNPTYIGYRNQKEMMQAQQGAAGQGGAAPGGPAGFGQDGKGVPHPSFGQPEQQAQAGVMSQLQSPQKPKQAKKPEVISHRGHDRFHPEDAEEWETTYRSVSDADLKKAVSPYASFTDF